jgi:hypothetical protein
METSIYSKTSKAKIHRIIITHNLSNNIQMVLLTQQAREAAIHSWTPTIIFCSSSRCNFNISKTYNIPLQEAIAHRFNRTIYLTIRLQCQQTHKLILPPIRYLRQKPKRAVIKHHLVAPPRATASRKTLKRNTTCLLIN